ncbi:MAG TPA: VWA domain-containing protein [Armatimonadota bacterium]|nr:VWA domain-containing protein [Armatimonadota bacterium]
MPGVIAAACNLSNRCVLAGSESRLKLLARVTAAAARTERVGLNVCLAIDRSFSMQEDHKLEHAREAACAFVDTLQPGDIFSLVEFGTDVKVAIEAQPLKSTEPIKQVIQQIRPHSATNLFGALHAAGAQVARAHDPNRINRVILISDGIPTEGVTDEHQILDVAKSAHGLGISITTLGLGQDYDETLLAGISDASHGNHYYVEDAVSIRTVFDREMKRMSSVVARDVSLRVKPADGFRIDVASTRYRSRSRQEGHDCVVALDDMERGGSQPVFFNLEVPALNAGEILACEMMVGCREIDSGPTGAEGMAEARVNLEVSGDAKRVQEGIDRAVLRQWAELESVETVAAAVEKARTGALGVHEVVDLIASQTRVLEGSGSAKAAMLSQMGRTIVEQGAVTSEVAKKTVVERIRAQQGE